MCIDDVATLVTYCFVVSKAICSKFLLHFFGNTMLKKEKSGWTIFLWKKKIFFSKFSWYFEYVLLISHFWTFFGFKTFCSTLDHLKPFGIFFLNIFYLNLTTNQSLRKRKGLNKKWRSHLSTQFFEVWIKICFVLFKLADKKKFFVKHTLNKYRFKSFYRFFNNKH